MRCDVGEVAERLENVQSSPLNVSIIKFTYFFYLRIRRNKTKNRHFPWRPQRNKKKTFGKQVLMLRGLSRSVPSLQRQERLSRVVMATNETKFHQEAFQLDPALPSYVIQLLYLTSLYSYFIFVFFFRFFILFHPSNLIQFSPTSGGSFIELQYLILVSCRSTGSFRNKVRQHFKVNQHCVLLNFEISIFKKLVVYSRFDPPLWSKWQHVRLSRSGPGFDPRSGQVSWVRFFLGFSSPVRQISGNFRPPRSPNIISFGRRHHHSIFVLLE